MVNLLNNKQSGGGIGRRYPDNNRKVGIDQNSYPAQALTKQINCRFESYPDCKKNIMEKLDVKINDVSFQETPKSYFVVYGEEDKFPFLDSVFHFYLNSPLLKVEQPPIRKYKSIVINGKFYAPIIEKENNNK